MCAAVHVRRILHCLGVGKSIIIQQVGTAVSGLNKTKNMCSCKSIIEMRVSVFDSKVAVERDVELQHYL